MQNQELDEIAAAELIQPGIAPAAALGVAVRSESGWKVYTGASGSLVRGNPGRALAVHVETPFDLASLSKPFLAVLCARLVQAGELSWDTPLGTLLPEARATPVASAPIELLLSHRVGLKAHVPCFAPLSARMPVRKSSALRQVAFSMRAGCKQLRKGKEHPPVYSDLGYLLVGAGLETAQNKPLDALLAKHVLAPLALEIGSARQWLARGDFKRRVAPTELVVWRGSHLRGVVHDDNCWALSGHGYAGHAGLFAPVEPLLKFGGVISDAINEVGDTFLSRRSVNVLIRQRPGGTLRCGFDGKANEGSSAGATAGPNSIGHLGFTGTSIWCDPDAQIVSVVLTNRVNPTRDNPRIRAARPVVHERLFRFARQLNG